MEKMQFNQPFSRNLSSDINFMKNASLIGHPRDSSDSDSLKERVLSHLQRKIDEDKPVWNFGNSLSSFYSPNMPNVLETVSSFKLPDFLLRQIESAEFNCAMGLLPEIERVWMAIDNRLFLWSYNDSQNSDFYSYEGMEDKIIMVGLVKPKKGSVDSKIQWLLVLVSTIEIRMVGVILNESNEISLYRTNMSVFTDNILMVCMEGLESGQVFLGGSDGNLYELQYEKEEAWFKRQCQLKNHTRSIISMFVPTFIGGMYSGDPICQICVDEKRRLLYTLSKNSEIRVFTLNPRGDSSLGYDVSYYGSKKILDEIRKLRNFPSVRYDRAMQAISLHVIDEVPSRSSKNVSLMVVTSGGYRVFFQSYKSNPAHLDIFSLRVLPSEDERDVSGLPISSFPFETTFYSKGSFFASRGNERNMNSLFFSTFDMGVTLKKGELVESRVFSSTKERVWAITEVKKGLENFVYADEDIMNDLYEQVVRPPRTFKILTNNAVYTAVKRRYADFLVDSLQGGNGVDSHSVRSFFESLGPEQACAICLAIACENRFAIQKTDTSGAPIVSNQIKNMAAQLFIKYGVSEKISFGDSYRGRSSFQVNDVHIVAYHSILLYFSRLVRGIWNAKLIDLGRYAAANRTLLILDNLLCFKDYLGHLSQIFGDEEERIYILSIVEILDTIIQVIECVTIILPENSSDIIAQVSNARVVSSMVFRDFITHSSSMQAFTNFVQEAVDIIAKESSIDFISESLKTRCPDFFKAEDLKICKARDLLNSVSLRRQDPLKLMDEALSLLLAASEALSIDKLKSFCEIFKNFGNREAAIRIAMECAIQSDKDNLALEWYEKELESPNIPAPSIAKRDNCYDIAISIADELIEQLRNENSVEKLEKAYQFDPIFTLILQNDDEYFHYKFFDHLCQKKQLVYLLKILDVPFLEKYLFQNRYRKSELGLYLCILYRNMRRYEDAVAQLYLLATDPDFPAELEKRIELLTLALSISESRLSKIDEASVEELQDLLDVANVQLQLYKALDLVPHAAPLREELDRCLLNVTDLYGYADRLDLDEIKLSIFNTSNHRDFDLLQSVWAAILDKETNFESKCATLIRLAGIYRNNDIVFPIETMIPFFEQYGMREPVDPFWLVKSLLQAGYKHNQLFNTYHGLYNDKIYPFQDQDGRMDAIEKITFILSDWTKNEQITQHDMNVLDERISNYKIFLSNHHNSKASKIQQKLSAVVRDAGRVR